MMSKIWVIKHTITSDNQEFVFFCNLMYCHVRIGGDNLLLGNQRVVLLELEVSQSPRECQIS